jgi:GDP-L-galactose phosphorylase
MIFDRGARVMVFPQCFAEKQARGEVPEDVLETGVNPACFEIAGHIVYKRQEDYVHASQEAACRLLAEVSLPEARFAQVLSLLG